MGSSSAAQIKYRNTPKGYLGSLYGGIKRRSESKNIPCFTKEELLEFGLGSEKFHTLFKLFIATGRQRKYAPSVDRICPRLGYVKDNVQWLTVGENSRKYQAYLRKKERSGVREWLRNVVRKFL